MSDKRRKVNAKRGEADRLLTVTYPAAKDNVTYDYDQGNFGIGELTTITENFGTTTYDYDNLGHMRAMNRTIFGVSYQTGYEYDLAGEITAITYPSGTRIEYARDGAARITAVTLMTKELNCCLFWFERIG